MDLLTLLLIVLIVAFFLGGNFVDGGRYRGHGFSLGGLLLVVLLVLLFARGI